jgi:uncharacterized protein (DUF305 family)
LLVAAAAFAGSGAPQPASAQGAPGSVQGVPLRQAALNPADVRFISGMIAHHAQAVRMALWAPSHGASGAVRELCERIVVSQHDEIAFMRRWLAENRQAVPRVDSAGRVTSDEAMAGMPGMDHELMPGMLTPEQLAQLDAARGPDFDRLFLQFMIQHHQGALTMVQQLVTTPGAAQDGQVFKFASDVNADQSAEIDRMRRMLAALLLREGNE